MATLRGTVTKTTSTNPWLARRAAGEYVGYFQSLREAQKEIERSSTGRALRWVEETRNTGVEAYRGEDA